MSQVVPYSTLDRSWDIDKKGNKKGADSIFLYEISSCSLDPLSPKVSISNFTLVNFTLVWHF